MFQPTLVRKLFLRTQQHAGRPVCLCLIYNDIVAVLKEFNVKEHFEKKHDAYSKVKGQLRKDIIIELQKNLEKRQLAFTKWSGEAESNTRASFAVSALIGKCMTPFTYREFVKDFLMAVVDLLCLEKKQHPVEDRSCVFRCEKFSERFMQEF